MQQFHSTREILEITEGSKKVHQTVVDHFCRVLSLTNDHELRHWVEAFFSCRGKIQNTQYDQVRLALLDRQIAVNWYSLATPLRIDSDLYQKLINEQTHPPCMRRRRALSIPKVIMTDIPLAMMLFLSDPVPLEAELMRTIIEILIRRQEEYYHDPQALRQSKILDTCRHQYEISKAIYQLIRYHFEHSSIDQINLFGSFLPNTTNALTMRVFYETDPDHQALKIERLSRCSNSDFETLLESSIRAVVAKDSQPSFYLCAHHIRYCCQSSQKWCIYKLLSLLDGYEHHWTFISLKLSKAIRKAHLKNKMPYRHQLDLLLTVMREPPFQYDTSSLCRSEDNELANQIYYDVFDELGSLQVYLETHPHEKIGISYEFLTTAHDQQNLWVAELAASFLPEQILEINTATISSDTANPETTELEEIPPFCGFNKL